MESLYIPLSDYFNDFPLDPITKLFITAKTLSCTILSDDLIQRLYRNCLNDEVWQHLPKEGPLRSLFHKLEAPRHLFSLTLLSLFLHKGSPFIPTYIDICQYRNKEIALYLATTLLSKGDDPDYEHTYRQLAVRSSLRLPMIHLSLWVTDSASLEEALFIKNRFHPSLQTTFLQTLQTLELTETLPPKQKLHLLKNICTEVDLKTALKLFYILLKTQYFKAHTLPNFSLDTLKEKVASQVLRELLELGTESPLYIEAYWALSATERYAGSLALFFASIRSLNDSVLTGAMRRFFISLVKDTFPQDRYEVAGHPHLEYLAKHHPKIWSKWCLLKDPMLTDHWQDLLLSGTEIAGSCQKLDGAPHFNQCLISTLLDGKIKLIALKKPDGTLIARAFIKLLITKEGSPALFLERAYPFSLTTAQSQAIREKALFLSRHLDIPLFMFSETPQGFSLSSMSSRGPEYEDGLGHTSDGVTQGIYTLTHVRLCDLCGL